MGFASSSEMHEVHARQVSTWAVGRDRSAFSALQWPFVWSHPFELPPALAGVEDAGHFDERIRARQMPE